MSEKSTQFNVKDKKNYPIRLVDKDVLILAIETTEKIVKGKILEHPEALKLLQSALPDYTFILK